MRETWRAGDAKTRREEIRDRVAASEMALTSARAMPYEVPFQTRVELALTLADLYLAMDDVASARELLDEETAFAEKIFQVVRLTGTVAQKRAAAGGRTQLRDRARQLALLGKSAPDIFIKDWLQGEATTLAGLRGRVVLLEFWATWCQPCREMFPKLKQLNEQHRARGLEIVALTRHYLSSRDIASSEAEELELMRGVVEKHGLKFRVGVAADERTQELYGATGVPTLVLIDRQGIVRYAHFGSGEDAMFDRALSCYLDEQ